MGVLRRSRANLAVMVRPAAAMTVVAALALDLVLLRQNPALRTPSDALLLLGYLGIFHAALIGALTALVATVLALCASRPGWNLPPSTVRLYGVVMTCAVVLVVNAMLRFTLSYSPFRQPPYRLLTPLGAVDLAAFVGLPLVLFFALRHLLDGAAGVAALRSRRRAAALLAAWLVFSAGAVGWTVRAEMPRRRSLDPMPVAAAPAVVPAGDAPSAVLVIGLDGLDWHVLAALFAQERLPHLARLVARGVRANLTTTMPTLSPAIWTSIATGRRAEEHGIHGWNRYRLPGMHGFIAAGPTLGTMNWWNGINRGLVMAANRHWIERVPVFATDWTAPAVWEVAAHAGMTVGVFGWLASWPVAAAAPGSYLVSDTSGRVGSIAPPESVGPILARATIPPPAVPPDSPLAAPALADRWRPEHEDFAKAVHLHQELGPRLALVYSHFIDGMQHRYWRGEERTRFLLWPDARRFQVFPPHIEDSYVLADQWIGALLAVTTPGTLVVVVSDHGYSFDGLEHHRAPDGVLIVAGPGVRPNTVLAAASIYDIAPTVLAVLGLPIAEQLAGRVLTDVFIPGAEPLGAPVASYEWFTPRPHVAPRAAAAEATARERLRAAGYVE